MDTNYLVLGITTYLHLPDFTLSETNLTIKR